MNIPNPAGHHEQALKWEQDLAVLLRRINLLEPFLNRTYELRYLLAEMLQIWL